MLVSDTKTMAIRYHGITQQQSIILTCFYEFQKPYIWCYIMLRYIILYKLTIYILMEPIKKKDHCK